MQSNTLSRRRRWLQLEWEGREEEGADFSWVEMVAGGWSARLECFCETLYRCSDLIVLSLLSSEGVSRPDLVGKFVRGSS